MPISTTDIYRTRFKNLILDIDDLLIGSANLVTPPQREILLQGLGLGNYFYSGHESKRLRGTIGLLIHSSSECTRLECRYIPAILELIHAASLIVDDLQEGHKTRWGMPALWVSRGHALAINTAIALISLAYKLNGYLEFSNSFILSGALNRMLEGQALDLTAERYYSRGLRGYLRIANGKTGALLNLAVELGGHALSYDANRHLLRWARGLGIIHQIQDDLDDIINKSRNEPLPSSNLHYFIQPSWKESTCSNTISFGFQLSSKLIHSSIREASLVNVSTNLKADLTFMADALGNRHAEHNFAKHLSFKN